MNRRKILSLLIVSSLVLSICGCKSDNTNAGSQGKNEGAVVNNDKIVESTEKEASEIKIPVTDEVYFSRYLYGDIRLRNRLDRIDYAGGLDEVVVDIPGSRSPTYIPGIPDEVRIPDYVSLPSKGQVLDAETDEKSPETFKVTGFLSCSSTEVSSIIFPTTLEWIGECAFLNKTTIESVTISPGLKYIGDKAFEGCTSLTSISLPSTMLDAGEYTFNGCTGLKSAHIRGGILPAEGMGTYFFEGCTSLTEIIIENGDHEIEVIAGCFAHDCVSLVDVSLPDSVKKICWDAFRNCVSLKEIVLPAELEFIGSGAFENCTSLTTITIPDKVTKLNVGAFKDCTSLTTITFPESVTYMEGGVLDGCTSLESIRVKEGSYADQYFQEDEDLKSKIKYY